MIVSYNRQKFKQNVMCHGFMSVMCRGLVEKRVF